MQNRHTVNNRAHKGEKKIRRTPNWRAQKINTTSLRKNYTLNCRRKIHKRLVTRRPKHFTFTQIRVQTIRWALKLQSIQNKDKAVGVPTKIPSSKYRR